MKTLALIAALLVCTIEPALAGSNRQAQQALLSAAERFNLLDSGSNPWQLEVEFEAQLALPTDRGPALVPVTGHLTFKWISKDKWWRKVEMDQFEQIDVRDGEMLYTSRSADVTPLRLKDVFDLLEGLPVKGLLVNKQKTRSEKGISFTCFETHYEQSQPRREVCLDASHDIKSIEWSPVDSQRLREQFADYTDFQGYRFPRTLELFANGTKVVGATVVSLSSAAIDGGLLVPPKGAIARRQCENMKWPVAISSPDPIPSNNDLFSRHLDTELAVVVTVQTDGTIGEIHVVGASHTQVLDESMVRTLKSWKFKPAMCGSEPVISDVNIVIHTKY